MVTIQVQQLIDFVTEVFAHSQSSPEEARRIATYLTTANLTGHDSHGVIRVPVYIRWKKSGAVVPDQTAEFVLDTPSLAVVDGKFGYGQTVTPQAVRIGIEKCKKAGLAAVALRNAGHIGRVGDWAEMAAAEGLISVHFVNAAGSLLVAPFGGVEKRLRPRPIASAFRARARIRSCSISHLDRRRRQGAGRKPRRQDPQGRADRCRRHPERGSGRALWALHAEGPRDHTKGTGAIRAFGEHKGSGLAFICELLGGALTGTGATSGAGALPTACWRSTSIRSGRYLPFLRRRNLALCRLHPGHQAGAGVDPVLIPGDPERKTRADAPKTACPCRMTPGRR